jgi:hypothetical protein
MTNAEIMTKLELHPQLLMMIIHGRIETSLSMPSTIRHSDFVI